MTEKILLDIKNLKTRFHTENGIVRAVDGIDFQLKKGETLGIVGESGSGKSVTALSIMKLVPFPGQSSGQILFQTKTNETTDLLSLDFRDAGKFRGNEIAMIFQEPMTSLNPVFKCGDQIAETIRLHQKCGLETAKKQTLELFEKVKLPENQRIFNAYPHQLSGGQKQRVMIAMALSCRPNILIADEPTTALDVTVQKAILELIHELKTEFNTSVIFISHDLGVIAEIADRILVMFKGKIMEQGRVADIFNKPVHPYTKSLLACRPRLEYKLKRLPVAEDFLEIISNGNGEWSLREKETQLSQVIDNQKITNKEHQSRIKTLSAQKPILEVKNLNTRYPAKRNFWGNPVEYVKAVDDVSFEVYPGETLGLVGESGCGKTTLGRTILRLTQAQSGKVKFDGKSISDMSEKEFHNLRKDLQIIFQDSDSALNPRQPIGNAILEPLTAHKLFQSKNERRDRAFELLELVGLKEEYFFRLPHEFSGGQKQRICIARALATNPRFIICDECVSSLDVSIQAQILNLLMDLREQNKLSYIFISHDLSVVKFMSDRMMVMNNGRIVEMEDAELVYYHPKEDYTKKLIEAIPKGL